MSTVLKISEATSLALHSTALLAQKPGRLVSTKEIASELKVSEAHLSKVLQRLSRVGIVKAIRGPSGGFALGKPASEIALVDIYESIEGPFVDSKCLLDLQVCNGNGCILGGFLGLVDKQFREYLTKTKLSELSIHIKGKENAENKEHN
jgi:Rrf2 family nitric oxide-sensitive transcriptional repressor